MLSLRFRPGMPAAATGIIRCHLSIAMSGLVVSPTRTLPARPPEASTSTSHQRSPKFIRARPITDAAACVCVWCWRAGSGFADGSNRLDHDQFLCCVI